MDFIFLLNVQEIFIFLLRRQDNILHKLVKITIYLPLSHPNVDFLYRHAEIV